MLNRKIKLTEILSDLKKKTQNEYIPFEVIVSDYRKLAQETVLLRGGGKGELQKSVQMVVKETTETLNNTIIESQRKVIDLTQENEKLRNKIIDSDNLRKLREEEIEGLKNTIEELEKQIEGERDIREKVEISMLDTQKENDVLLIQLKNENLKRVEFFEEYMKKEELLMEEMRKIEKEKKYLSDKEKVLRSYISDLTHSNGGDIGNLEALKSNPMPSFDGGNDEFELLDVKYKREWAKKIHKKRITVLAQNLSSDVIATGSEDNYIRLFSLVHQKEISTIYNQERIAMSLDFHSHNTDLILAGNNNGVTNVWSLRTGRPKFTFTSHKEAVHTAKFFADRKCYTGSKDRSIRLWDLNKGNILHTYMCISPCTTSDNDGYLIYSGHKDGNLKLWSENKKTSILEKKIHSGKISHISLTRDNNYIVSMSKGKDISLFEMRMQKVVKTISIDNVSMPQDPVSFSIDREMSRIFLGDSEGKGHVIDLLKPIPKIVDTFNVSNTHAVNHVLFNNLLDSVIFTDFSGAVTNFKAVI